MNSEGPPSPWAGAAGVSRLAGALGRLDALTFIHGPEQRWWLLVDDGEAELCSQPPGRVEDVALVCRVRTLAEVFTGVTTVQEALRAGRLESRGAPKLTRNVHRWLRPSALVAVLRGQAR